MSEHTPTTEEVREWYTHRNGDGFYERRLRSRANEFDRWLSEHDRQVAERAWDRCVGEMPIDLDWKNLYTDQNPYRAAKGEQK